MTTKSINAAREQVASLKKHYDGMYRFPEAELRVKNGSTVVIVTCAIHGNFEIPLKDATEVCLCKKCQSLFHHLVNLSNKDEALNTLKEIYSFAFNNRRLVDRFRKSSKNRNNISVFYDMFKEAKKQEEEAAPVVVHQVADKTISKTIRNTASSRKFRTCSEALSDLNARFDSTLLFPKIHEEYTRIKSIITVICPIHGETKASFVRMYWTGSFCSKCNPLRKKLKLIYGDGAVFEKLLDQYRKAKNNPNYVEPDTKQLLIEAKMIEDVTDHKHTEVCNDRNEIKNDQPDIDTSAITNIINQHVSTMSDRFSKEPVSDNDNWQQDIVPVASVSEQLEEISPVKKRANDIIAFFNKLNLSDIVKLHTDIDLETEEETAVLSLKSGQTIKVC